MWKISTAFLFLLFVSALFHVYQSYIIRRRVRPSDNQVVKLKAPCVIPVYTFYTSPSFYQLKWLSDVVFSGVRYNCGCTIVMREQKEFDIDFRPWLQGKVQSPPFPKVVFAFSLYPANLVMPWQVHKYQKFLKENAILIHINDELELLPTDFYSKFRTVYRNYYGSNGGSLKLFKDISRDMTDSQLLWFTYDNNQRSWWLPLGYSTALIHSEAVQTPLINRTLLFFWSGSLASKPERRLFVDDILKNETILKAGRLKYFGEFQPLGHPDHIKPLEYSAYMYKSKVIPCPAGMSPEQYRISEALEVGAVPIVQKGHQHLRYLDRLGFKYIGIDSFSNVSSVLARVLNNPNYVKWLQESHQSHNTWLWDRVKKRIRSHVAANICYITT